MDPDLLDSLFARLVVAWGRDFWGQYEGVNLDAVRADWSRRLARFPTAAIRHALDVLPAKPLNAIGFRDLCRTWRSPEEFALLPPPGPAPIPPQIAAQIARLSQPDEDRRPLRVRIAERYLRRWGKAGLKLSPVQRLTLGQYRAVLDRWDDEQRARMYAAAATPIDPSEA